MEYPFASFVQLYACEFNGPESIKEETEEFKSIPKDYIVIGSAGNGDPIAIPKNTWHTIGYIRHEEIDYDENSLAKYCPVSKSIGEFYYNTWHKDNFPCDYYAALDYIMEK